MRCADSDISICNLQEMGFAFLDREGTWVLLVWGSVGGT